MNPRIQAVLAPAGIVALSCLLAFGVRELVSDVEWLTGKV